MTARLGQTPSQTVGPFFHYALPWRGGADLIGCGSDLGARPDLIPEGHDRLAVHRRERAIEGEAVEIRGMVTDADGAPVADALVEIWQAGSDGVYASPDDPRVLEPRAFLGFGRCATDDAGGFGFRTLKPGRTPGPAAGLQAPHLAVAVFGRGILKRLVTRLYFAGDAANAEDAILMLVPEGRRETLMARLDGGVWRFDIRLAGADETVFFDL